MYNHPILFFHSVDVENKNAQSNNVKGILSHWDSNGVPATAFHFQTPDPMVVANPNVKLIKLPRNRLWKLRAFAAGLGKYSGIVYPGLSAELDNGVRSTRSALGLGGAIITTLEGVPADQTKQKATEDRFSKLFGHNVYCQGIDRNTMALLSKVKTHANLLIAISPFLEIVANNLWPNVSSANIPLGVNLSVFNPNGRVPHGSNERVQIVSAGSFQERKRPFVFLELARQYPDVDFTWYGEGSERSELLLRAAQMGLSNFFLPGALDAESLSAAFRKSDIFTLPSISEGVPKVSQEAAACGLPIVCMQYYEPHSVNHGVNGFLAVDDAAYSVHTDLAHMVDLPFTESLDRLKESFLFAVGTYALLSIYTVYYTHGIRT